MCALAALLSLAGIASAATVTITSTINVAAGATYDGHGNTIKAVGMGDGGQGESQKPFFKIASGGTVKNVILAAPGVDGIHFVGTSGTVDHVTWQDIGEDAITVKSPGGTHVLSNSTGNQAADKFQQCNAADTWTMTNVVSNVSGKCLRQNGGTSFKCTFYFNNYTSINAHEAIGRTDSSTTRFRYHNLKVSGFGGSKGWWYGRDSQASAF